MLDLYYNNFRSELNSYKELMDSVKPKDDFKQYYLFCISHKATVKRIKNKSKRK